MDAYRQKAARKAGSVLLEAARGRSLLFEGPVEVLRARSLRDLPGMFAGVEAARGEGLWAAGYVSYECGYHWEPTAMPGWEPEPGGLPLACFGLYRQPICFEAEATASGAAGFEEVRPGIGGERFGAKVERVRELIAAGDAYQVNLTDRVTAEARGSAAGLFAAMMEAQPVEYGAMLHFEDRVILSASPELFFRKEGRRVTVRPMKGTARRGRSAEEDEELGRALAADGKNRAENIMIVDLLRSDLGRVAVTGSVRVERLFEVERFPSLLQMSSEIAAELRPEVGLYGLFRALFPSGSVVGAPKVRAMQIVRELEGRDRNVYTGAIGYVEPSGDAVFSVAIRTGVLEAVLEGERFRMGVGAGITWDSAAADEYAECLLKAEFLREEPFRLIETMRWEDGACALLGLHLGRLRRSAAYFGFVCEGVGEALGAHAGELGAGAWKVRMTVGRAGGVAFAEPERIAEEAGTPRVMLWPERVCSRDRWLAHKTTRREVYDRAVGVARERGFVDAIFRNERGEVTEGAVHNLFMKTKDAWRTPPLGCGVLPGVFRAHLLGTRPEIREEAFEVEALLEAEEVWVCNAVRGMRRVEVVPAQDQAWIQNTAAIIETMRELQLALRATRK